MNDYIKIGKVNRAIMKKINIKLITDEVIFTFERIKHVKERRIEVFEQMREILPIAIYEPDYIYSDWNNRDSTLIFIKNINKKLKLSVVLKIAIEEDKKHNKNSIITIMKLGSKTFKKILNNKNENFLYKKLDKDE